ncbi:MAG: hypothetical protein IKZ12_04235 [Alistipes sp.]|nr:hypothetical protein [Alistipes sp.]
MNRIKTLLARLSFRTGIIALCCAVLCYLASFAQMALPLSTTVKGVLWVIFFGLAKAAQYIGLAVLGAEGIKRFKALRRSRS